MSQTNSALVDQVTRDIAKLHQGSSKVHAYYNAMEKLWSELSTLQASDTDNNERVYQFLMGLNESYSNLRNSILATKPLPSVKTVYSIIESEETDRFIQICKKNVAEFLGDRRRNPYGGSISSGDRFRDYDFVSRYRGLFAPNYGSGGFSFA